MKNSFILGFVFVLCFASCKKGGNTPSAPELAQEKLIGEWKAEFSGEDLNDNGILEESEKNTTLNETAIFNTGGKGKYISVFDTKTMTNNTEYNFSDDVKVLNMTFRGETEFGFIRKVAYDVNTFDTNILYLSVEADQTSSHKEWIYYKRIK